MPAEDVFMDFIAAMEARDMAAALALLAEDVEYDNVPMGPVHGHEAVQAMLGPLLDSCTEVRWTVHRRASHGPVVFTERTDVFTSPSGSMSIPVTGVAEVHDGKITLWRDYFDLATMTNQLESLAGGETS